jgi:hypothetical protein
MNALAGAHDAAPGSMSDNPTFLAQRERAIDGSTTSPDAPGSDFRSYPERRYLLALQN